MRIGWLDLLKVIAVFMVIAAYANDAILVNQNGDFNFTWGTYIGALLRFMIPLFVMISGILLLPVRLNILDFYKKYFWRILPALFFWGIAYILFDGLFLNHKPAARIWMDIARLPLNFAAAAPHLWYLYMLAGLYLIIPMVSPWVLKATKRELQVVLAIFIFSTFIPYIRFLTGLAFGASDWNEFHSFYYISGFFGYLLMGYYLFTYLPVWSNSLKRFIGALLFLIGYGITYYLTISVPFSLSNIEMVWYYCSPNVLLEAVGIFLLVEGLELKAGFLSRVIHQIAAHTFGIFLIQYFFIGFVFRYVAGHLNFHPVLNILCAAFLTMVISFAITWLIGKNRIGRKLVM